MKTEGKDATNHKFRSIPSVKGPQLIIELEKVWQYYYYLQSFGIINIPQGRTDFNE